MTIVLKRHFDCFYYRAFGSGVSQEDRFVAVSRVRRLNSRNNPTESSLPVSAWYSRMDIVQRNRISEINVWIYFRSFTARPPLILDG